MSLAKDPISTYYSHCLRADLKAGLRVLKRSNSGKNNRLSKFVRRAQRRFVLSNEPKRKCSGDPFIDSVIWAYRTYYRQALLKNYAPVKLEAALDRTLKEILAIEKPSAQITRNSLEDRLQKEISKRGWYSLFGRVAPLRSAMIWKKQTSKKYEVLLPESRQKVNVIFMEGFVELGWLHYATFGKAYVGGWAKKNALYCVKQSYDIQSNSFRAHYLAHEAQHFSDYRRFPKLQPPDLEYRAKLAELSVSQRPAKFLRKIKLEFGNDRLKPHCFAAYKILGELENSSSKVKPSATAQRLLREHTRALEGRGAKRVTTCLS